METDWTASIAFVLEQEGGYTLDPHDPGGETNFGISKKAYPALDIKALTVEQAKDIYRRDYWAPCGGDALPGAFAISIFDTAVNMGVGKASRMMQLALGVKEDGILGPLTLHAAEDATPRQVKKFLALRLAEYARLMVANPRLLEYALNWSYRVIALADRIATRGGAA